MPDWPEQVLKKQWIGCFINGSPKIPHRGTLREQIKYSVELKYAY